ncbi:MAG: CoA transferase, partial [Deltaproteobacteria bacterium]|nr:CoA transferase [Deltaproteobacteria bacterium]
ATMVSGPYCGKLLGDMGADVVKVEPPEGDSARFCGPFPSGDPHPEQSALFLYVNTSKRGVTLDVGAASDLDLFRRLIRWAHVLIDNHPPEHMKDLGLDWDVLQEINPALVYVSITPYGRTGPRAGIRADELTITHAGGIGSLLPARSVDIDRPPVKLGGYQAGYYAGLTAALTVSGVLHGRKETDRGHLIDISQQEVILSKVSPLVASYRYHGTTWHRVPDRPPAMGRMETRDGYVALGANDDHHFRLLRELMGKPDWLTSDDWDDMTWRIHHLMDIAPEMEAWMREQRKDEIHRRIGELAIPIGPFKTAAEVMASEQYRARGYFTEVVHPAAGRHRYAGWPYRMTASPPEVGRPAPLLGQHNEEIRREFFESERGKPGEVSPVRVGSDRKSAEPGKAKLPLAGIRVLEFCWVWAGPYACMLLASLGAEVIRIESHKRTDLTRRYVVWPLPEPAPFRVPPNQGIPYNTLNRFKKSLTIDLTLPEGIALVRRLAAISDVVVDNLRPGAMGKLGLGYGDLKTIRPDIIVVSSSSRGQVGPEARYLGYATLHQAIGGLAYVTGHPDDAPSHGTPGDADLMNATAAAFATVAALHHRQRTGEGQFIDFSQCEGVSSLIGEMLLGYEMNGRIPERMGNAHPRYAPHNVYRCWGVDRWLALEVHSDGEFALLAGVIGQPELAGDSRFATMEARKENERELDAVIESWTRIRDRDWLAGELCRAGLAAAPCRDAADLYADRHLQERQAFVRVDHPEVGPVELVGLPWKISGMEAAVVRAPLLGEHNAYVLGELLGLGDGEIAGLRAAGVIL